MRANSPVLDPSAKYLANDATALTRIRYQRIAPLYDKIQSLMEGRFRPWRQKLWKSVRGREVLEVGVGTGKNIEFWPANAENAAIDLTPGDAGFCPRARDES